MYVLRYIVKYEIIKAGLKFTADTRINFIPINYLPKKEKVPTFLYIGLLKKTNIVNHAIDAFRIISKRIPDAQLWIAGKGPELKNLKLSSKGLNVKFFGYVNEETKLDIMQRSHALLIPAIREGWGLVVTEANACGTPAIGYDVPGLRDSIKNQTTGILTKQNYQSLADSAINLIIDTELRKNLSSNALEWSKEFTWEDTTKQFERILMENIHG